MNIYREGVNRMEIPALASLDGGYILLRFERGTSNVYCVLANESGMGKPITVTMTEIGTGTPVPTDGEVLLAPGRWTMYSYEQVGNTNTNPDCDVIPLTQQDVNVYGEDAAILNQTPTTCSGGGGGAVDSVNGETGTVVLDATDLDVIDFLLVYGAGTPGANGVYPYVGESNSKPSYQKGTGNGSHLVTWGAVADQWTIGLVDLSPTYYYNSTDDVATPNLATFTVTAGAGPVPTVELFTGTIQQAIQALATLTGEVAEALTASTPPVVAQRTGSVIAFNAAAIYNSGTTPTSGTITYDLSGATVGVEVIAYFNHSSAPTFPVGTVTLGVWDPSNTNSVEFTYGPSGVVVAVINSNNQGSYTSKTSRYFPTTDQSTSGITLVGITGISKTLAANKRYVVTGKLRVLGTATGGLKLGAIYSAASPAVVQFIHLIGRSLATSSTGVLSDQMTASTGYNNVTTVAMSPSTSTQGYVFFDGTIAVAGADVDFQLAFASATAGQTAQVYLEGSHFELTEL